MKLNHMEKRRTPRQQLHWLLVGYFVIQILFVFCASDAYLLRVDDAYYYFGIARQFVETGQFSFDGIHLTNGFQALWQFTVIGIMWLAEHSGIESRASYVTCTLLLCAILNTVSAFFLIRLGEKSFSDNPMSIRVFVYLALWFPGLTTSLLCGMENSLNWMLLLLLIWILMDERGHPVLRRISVGRMFGLVFVSALFVYTRVDNSIILASIGIFFLFAEWGWVVLRRVVLWGLGVLILWIPLLAWQWYVFDSATPVSGSVKLWRSGAYFDSVGMASYCYHIVEAFFLSVVGLPLAAIGMGYYEIIKPVILAEGLEKTIALSGMTLVLAVVGGVRWAAHEKLSSRWTRAPRLLPVLLLVCVVDLGVHSVLFPDQWRYAGLIWYYLPEYLLLFLATAWFTGGIAESLGRRLSRVGRLSFLVLYVIGILPLYLWRPHAPTEQQLKYIAATWMNDNLPPNSIVAARNAGVTGYYSDVPVVNLDGLVNDVEFFEAYLKNELVGQYLRDSNVTFLADHRCPSRIPGWYRRWVYVTSEDQIRFHMKGNEKDLEFCILDISERAPAQGNE